MCVTLNAQNRAKTPWAALKSDLLAKKGKVASETKKPVAETALGADYRVFRENRSVGQAVPIRGQVGGPGSAEFTTKTPRHKEKHGAFLCALEVKGFSRGEQGSKLPS